MDAGMGSGMGRGGYREMEPEPAAPQDLTLGMPALVGIFLAVVLVCAVFFGFGYSTGRTLHGAKAAVSSSGAAPGSSAAGGAGSAVKADESGAATSTPPLSTVEPVAKPSPGLAMSADSHDAGAGSQAQAVDEPAGFPPDSRTASPAAHSAYLAPENTEDDASSSAVPAATGGVMVQIAAVGRQADAEMLARALRSNGYAAVVRSEPQDKFLHVQVGPFATRDQARAMRARLQGDGYNAFLKP
jgi:cell division septation protein DedD